jgi:TolA-binding protein
MMKAIVVCSGVLTLLAICPTIGRGQDAAGEVEQLRQQVRQLEERVEQLEHLLMPMKEELQTRARRAKLRQLFEQRVAQDAANYTAEQMQEISRLYQVANRQFNSPEAKESLKKLIDKYGNANRTGCALQYLGQMSQGEEKEKYLTAAIEKHGDCFYGDGVQVGAYARLHLAMYYRQLGKEAEAKRLLDELRENYTDAVDHQGRLLRDILP